MYVVWLLKLVFPSGEKRDTSPLNHFVKDTHKNLENKLDEYNWQLKVNMCYSPCSVIGWGNDPRRVVVPLVHQRRNQTKYPPYTNHITPSTSTNTDLCCTNTTSLSSYIYYSHLLMYLALFTMTSMDTAVRIVWLRTCHSWL